MSNLEKIKNVQNELGEVPVWAMAEKYGPFTMDSKNGFWKINSIWDHSSPPKSLICVDDHELKIKYQLRFCSTKK